MVYSAIAPCDCLDTLTAERLADVRPDRLAGLKI